MVLAHPYFAYQDFFFLAGPLLTLNRFKFPAPLQEVLQTRFSEDSDSNPNKAAQPGVSSTLAPLRSLPAIHTQVKLAGRQPIRNRIETNSWHQCAHKLGEAGEPRAPTERSRQLHGSWTSVTSFIVSSTDSPHFNNSTLGRGRTWGGLGKGAWLSPHWAGRDAHWETTYLIPATCKPLPVWAFGS